MPPKVWLFLLASAVALHAQGRAGKGFAQPQGAREVAIAAIPGVIAAGVHWTLAWQGTNNADGIIGTADGGLLFAQEQPSQISKLDANDRASVFLENTGGAGAIAIQAQSDAGQGRILVVQRTCTDPGGHPADCHQPTAVAVLWPERKVLADNIAGQSLGRLNDLMVSQAGGVYFNGDGTFYLDPRGHVSSFGEGLRTNGILLSRDEKTLYVTNGQSLVAFDLQPGGSPANQRDFARLEAGGTGDGMAIDAAGRLYVSTQPGVQVIGPDGKYLGLIPTPRAAISVAFAGPGKKTLYVVGSGALGPDGQEFTTPPGVRNNAKSIYKIPMLAEGFAGRGK